MMARADRLTVLVRTRPCKMRRGWRGEGSVSGGVIEIYTIFTAATHSGSQQRLGETERNTPDNAARQARFDPSCRATSYRGKYTLPVPFDKHRAAVPRQLGTNKKQNQPRERERPLSQAHPLRAHAASSEPPNHSQNTTSYSLNTHPTQPYVP